MNRERPAFLTIKWGTEFDADDLNTLKRAALDNTTHEVRFICLTDDGSGLDPDIEVYPIPEFELYAETPRSGVWPKISLFHPDMSAYADLFVFLDIDTVVAGSLDALFEDPGEALVLLSCGLRWRNMDTRIEPEAATGIMTYRPAHHSHIFTTFTEDIDHFTSIHTVEQRFVGATAYVIKYYPIDWVQSFKYHLRRWPTVDLFLAPHAPNPATKLIAFHGFPRPRPVADPNGVWAKTPNSGKHKPGWLVEYFKQYSEREF